MVKIISLCKNGVRYDFPITKQEPIAEDKPVISTGAIVSRNMGSTKHKGKVLDVTGDVATVSWEDASMSEVPVSSLQYEGRVQSGTTTQGKTEGAPVKKGVGTGYGGFAGAGGYGQALADISEADMHPAHSGKHKKKFPKGFNAGEADAKVGKPKQDVSSEDKSHQAGYHSGYHSVKGEKK